MLLTQGQKSERTTSEGRRIELAAQVVYDRGMLETAADDAPGACPECDATSRGPHATALSLPEVGKVDDLLESVRDWRLPRASRTYVGRSSRVTCPRRRLVTQAAIPLDDAVGPLSAAGDILRNSEGSPSAAANATAVTAAAMASAATKGAPRRGQRRERSTRAGEVRRGWERVTLPPTCPHS
jgi:hypothetical protein